jgi:hypothetical protein
MAVILSRLDVGQDVGYMWKRLKLDVVEIFEMELCLDSEVLDGD